MHRYEGKGAPTLSAQIRAASSTVLRIERSISGRIRDNATREQVEALRLVAMCSAALRDLADTIREDDQQEKVAAEMVEVLGVGSKS